MAETSRRVAERKPWHDIVVSLLLVGFGVYGIYMGGSATAVTITMGVLIGLVNTVQLRDFIEAYYMAKSPETYQFKEEEKERHR